MKDTMFITVLHYPSFNTIPSRLIIRDDREEMKTELRKVIDMKSSLFTVDTIAEYTFHKYAQHSAKYYTPEKFLES